MVLHHLCLVESADAKLRIEEPGIEGLTISYRQIFDFVEHWHPYPPPTPSCSKVNCILICAELYCFSLLFSVGLS